jgi:hypothetical protein
LSNPHFDNSLRINSNSFSFFLQTRNHPFSYLWVFKPPDKNTGKIEAKMEAWKPVLDKIRDLSEKVGELKLAV